MFSPWLCLRQQADGCVELQRHLPATSATSQGVCQLWQPQSWDAATGREGARFSEGPPSQALLLCLHNRACEHETEKKLMWCSVCVCVLPHHTHTHTPRSCLYHMLASCACLNKLNLIGYCELHSMNPISDDLRITLLHAGYMLNTNSLQSQYPTTTPPPPVFASFSVPGAVMGVSIQEEAMGLWGSSSSPRPSSPNAAQLPFRTPPLQPIHPGEPKKKVAIY